MVVDIATGAEHVIAPGVYPSWGGLRSESGNPGNPGAASVAIKGTKFGVASGRIKVRIACAATSACPGKATLGKARKTYAMTAYAVPAGKTAAVKLKLTKAGKARFRGDGRVALTLTLKPKSGTSAKKKITVKY